MKWIRVASAALLLLALPRPASALFHLSVIDEVMTSYDGDPNAQFVEIRMLFAAQDRVANSVLGAFDGSGNYQGDLLVLGADVANSGVGVRFIMGTTAFETASGIQVDFEFAPGLIQGSGMVCWGAPGLLPPANPGSWMHDDPANYVDCVAYGSYTGTGHPSSGDPTPLDADGHSLVRVSETGDNATDFACGDPATPTNNAGGSASLVATIPCPEPAATLLLAVGALVLAASGRARAPRGAGPSPGRPPARAEGV